MSEILGFQILALGLGKKVEEFIESCFVSGGTLVKISAADQFFDQFENWRDGDFAGIFCSSNIPELTGNELGQGLQNQCPNTNRYFIACDLSGYEPSVLLKNGFTNAFCLPQDRERLLRTIKEDVLANISGKKSLRPIKILDVGANEKLDFGTFVFLPLNNRFIPFSKSNESIENNRLEKLGKHQVGSLFIDKQDLDKFYSYSANRLGNAANPGMGVTERKARLEAHVHGLFSSIFDQAIKTDFAGGKAMLENCQNIISTFITKGTPNSWHHNLVASIGDLTDPYSHAARISALAALFAAGVNHPRPEDLAIAGMFHDLGMIDIPDSIANKDESQWSAEEKAIFQGHPERTMFYLKQKRVNLSADVERAILQHHEKISGAGYPRGLSDRISLEAQVLSYADQFEYLTRNQAGKLSLSPSDAHQEIAATRSIGKEILERLGALINSAVK